MPRLAQKQRLPHDRVQINKGLARAQRLDARFQRRVARRDAPQRRALVRAVVIRARGPAALVEAPLHGAHERGAGRGLRGRVVRPRRVELETTVFSGGRDAPQVLAAPAPAEQRVAFQVEEEVERMCRRQRAPRRGGRVSRVGDERFQVSFP